MSVPGYMELQSEEESMMDNRKKALAFGAFDYVTVKTDSEKLSAGGKNTSACFGDIRIEMKDDCGHEDMFLTADTSAVEWVKIRWNREMPKQVRILGDAWERGYGDLEWRGMCGSRFMPWYFLMSAGDRQWGYGVKVRPSSMCYWQVDSRGITLVMDVRSGGEGVWLNGRTLKMAELVSIEMEGSDSFTAAREFCRMMCTDPILPDFPVYGSNNWYYAYGDSSEEEILSDTDYVLKLTEGVDNPPFMVIDDCWQEHHRLNEYNGGPWRCGNSKFPDMKGLADKLTAKGVRPGIWVRLLQNEDEAIPDEWRLPMNGCLDPSHPGALEYIRQDVKRICDWGYTLIKHDFSTYDLFGNWGMEMNPLVTVDGWHFYDRSKTSAEVVKLLYQAIYEAAEPYHTLILGCNTIGHLGAGLMHMNRTGDDTSGITWERTRRMGINSLAFRLPQNGIFFDIDADCVGIAGNIPWKLNRQWADVIAQSGTSLFISVKPGILNDQEITQLREIMKSASRQDCHKVPVDWEYNDCPEIWADDKEEIRYSWFEDGGATLESNQLLYRISIPLS